MEHIVEKRLKTNFIYNSIYQILSMIVPIITTPYVSRVLGANGVGVYSFNYSVAAYFVMFILLGLNNYGNREIAKVRDSRRQLSKEFWSIYAFQIIMGITVNVIYIYYCLFIAENKIVALILGFYTISGMFDVNWFFFGMEEFKITVIRNTVVKLLSTICIFLFVKNQTDTIVYTLILSMSFLVSQLLLWPYLIRKVNFYRPSISDIKSHIKQNVFLFLTVVAVSIYKTMDKIMLGFFTDTVQVGYYESAEKIIQVPMLLITSLGTVMLPRMSNLVNNHKQQESTRLINKSILFAMFLSSSLCFGIMGVAREFVPVFYGQGFETCIYLFWVLLPSCLFLAFANVVRTQYVIPNQLDNIYVKSVFIGAVVNLIANLVLIKQYYSVGVAVGTLLAEMSVCIYICFKIRKELDMLHLVSSAIPYIVSGILMFIVLINVNIPIDNAILLIGVKILIGVITYFVVLLLQFLLKKLLYKLKNR